MADKFLPELDGLPNLAPDPAALLLMKLSPDQLQRCICVSKSWRDFIKSKFFANFFRTFKKLLLSVLFFEPQPQPPQVSLLLDSPAGMVEYIPLSDRFFRSFTALNPVFMSSCKGLVCLYGPELCIKRRNFFLWNPYLRKILTLPPSIFPCSTECSHLVGLGYDDIDDDYKLLKFRFPACHTFYIWDVELYSVNRRTWRVINVEEEYFLSPLHVESHDSGFGFSSSAFVNHAIHWVAYWRKGNEGKCLVLSFDMREEQFGEIELPAVLSAADVLDMSVLVFKETKLAVVLFDADTNTHQIWVMRKYGDPTSWYRLGAVNTGQRYFSLLAFRANGELLMQCLDDGIDSFNVSTNHSTRVVDGIAREPPCYVMNHVESLALLRVSAWSEWRD